MADLYDTDPYTWAMTQADALRRRSANEIDWDNVAEEIEEVGKSEARELRSRYVVLLAHLLKWAWQPEKRSGSWENTIITQRRLIAEHIVDAPGLKPRREALYARAYVEAVADAANETGMSVKELPSTCPYSLAQAMDEGFWPPEAAAGEG